MIVQLSPWKMTKISLKMARKFISLRVKTGIHAQIKSKVLLTFIIIIIIIIINNGNYDYIKTKYAEAKID